MKHIVLGLLGALALGIPAPGNAAAAPASMPTDALVQTVQYRPDGFAPPRHYRSRGHHRFHHRHSRRPHLFRGYQSRFHSPGGADGAFRRY